MLDENQNTAQDSSLDGLTSDGEGGTSAKEPRTYTEKEYSDALANAGRQAVERVRGEMQGTIDDLKRQLDEIEEAKLGDNPDAKTAFQLKKEKRDLQTALNKANQRLTELEEKAKKADEYDRMQTTRQLAQQYVDKYDDVTVEDLLAFTDGSKVKMDAFCKRYGKPKDGNGNVPDLNVTSGSGLSDAKFIEGIGNGTIPLDKESMARAKKLSLMK